MCEEQCMLYEDCCMKNSKFQINLSASQKKFACISTATKEFVYMITTCPSSWNESQDIQKNCHTIKDPLNTLNVWVLTPVTAHQSRITYKNMFCAFCNGEKNFNFWKIGVSCAPSNGSHKPESEHLLDPNDILGQMSPNGTYPIVWQSKVEYTAYHCSWSLKLTIDPQVEYCIPQSEIICTSSNNCSNYTSYEHIDNESSNHKVNISMGSFGCYTPKMNDTELPFMGNILNPHIIEVPHCHQIPRDAVIFHKICETPKPKSATGSSICFIDNQRCLINGWYVINVNITFLNNDTIYLKYRDISYPSSQWEALNGTNLVYVCGEYIPRSTFHQIVFVLDDWISEILIKFSIICLLLHLFIFQQLPQMKNFSGKNLAIFCSTLLVAFLCYEIGPKLRDCEITAIILHYSLLSCFTWSLIMSYDCWHTINLATKQLRNAGGERTIRLCIYCIISWLIPALIVSVALYFEVSSPKEIPCNKKIGYGKYKQCFIGQIYGLIMFFILPASCMFLCNICFFILTSFTIYGNQRSSVNPNSKIDFLMYTRLALMMGLTWTMGTLLFVTEYVLVGLMFSILNMSQGILIFFAFTVKQKILKLLLEKYKNNARISQILKIFIHDPVSEAPTQMTHVESPSKMNQ